MKYVFTLLAFFSLTTSFGQSFRHEVISQRLEDRIRQYPDEYHHFFIALKDRVDIISLNEDLRARRASLAERSALVITALQEKAGASQEPLLDWLEQRPDVLQGSAQPYWIANLIFVKAKASAIAELSWRQDIAFLDWNAPLAKTSTERVFSMANGVSPNGKEPGLSAIKAPALWAMGYTGYGRVAFTNDTGVDPSHPALAAQYRGFYGDPGISWYEFDSPNVTPYDCDDHGTHVTGTILGINRLGNDTIGVAFNAKWTGASTIGCGNGLGNQDNVGALQWAADPDGDPFTFEDMPDAINNSWYDPTIDDDCFSIYVDVLTALDALGVAVVFSAGNEGPDPQTISPPHNINTDLVNSFTVGALNGNTANLPIADFSSRGPSKCGGEGSLLIKPEVSAPGVTVRSSVPGGGYAFFNGTSMAAPHVTGAVLLLKEAFPYLAGHEIKLALYNTCTDLGEPGEDNVYGMGIIDVEKAYNYLLAEGNVPVAPNVNTDAMVIFMEAGEYQCEELVTGRILVENSGITTITSMEILMQAGAESQVIEWTGTLEPLERASIDLPSLVAGEGETMLSVEIISVNSAADDRSLNNRFAIPVIVKDRPVLQAVADAGPDQEVCEGSIIALRGVSQSAGTPAFSWYDAPAGGALLGTGPVLLAGPLSGDTTIYLEALYTQKTGLSGKEAGASQLGGMPAKEGLVFDAHYPFLLKTVKVYADQSGGRILKLLDAEGNTVRTKPTVVSSPGEVVISLNMNVPQGENFSLVLDAGFPLHLNTDGASYPYAVEDVLTIKGPYGTGIDTLGPGLWYYFYDWEIEYEELCGRAAVQVPVLGSGEATVAAFEVSADTIPFFEGAHVLAFTDQSTGAASWHWNFGDGNTSAEQNPEHSYAGPGVYTVTLSTGSADGCLGAAQRTVVVLADPTSAFEVKTDAGLKIFPNPANEALNLEWSAEAIEWMIFDIQGRPVASRAAQGRQAQVSLNGWASGLYYVVLRTQEGVSAAKFQVIR
ncbi:MAG: S8 family serine peptidase [Saprospiraceae bacterium]